MSNYDQYDLEDEDYGDEAEAFDENNLNDEDYNKLCELVPIVKEKTSGKFKGLTEDSIKEILWNNYFELNDTLDEISKTYKSKYEHAG